jgi:4-carboxymuconolactone decarboxylase
MTTFKETLLASSLAASAATGQESAPRVAPDTVRHVSPALAQYTDEVLFGEVWTRQDLGSRDRSLVTIAALVASGKTAQVAAHARHGLDNGLTPEEISEILVQLAFYSGWPNAVSAATQLEAVFQGVVDKTPVVS